MFKKIISMILTLALIAGNCSAIFAQSVGKIKYKPAKSFTYDFFTLCKTEEKTFIYRLKKDMDENKDEDTFEPSSLETKYIPKSTQDKVDRIDYFAQKNNRFNLYNSQINAYKPVAKAYNNFMYYNAYPKQ